MRSKFEKSSKIFGEVLKKAKIKTKETKNKKAIAQKARKAEVLACFEDLGEGLAIIAPLIDEMLSLEGRLAQLRTLPFILVNTNNPTIQQSTPAAKTYAQLLSRYADIVYKLQRMHGKYDGQEESPLRAYLRSVNE